MIIFEDEHLLVINKPAGMNTHAPAPYAGEGVYDWLRNRERRWAALAIIHRLDKETSGLIVFAKTPIANRSLTEQFTRRQVRKKYVLVTDRPVRFDNLTVASTLARVGNRYRSGPAAGGLKAETRFVVRARSGKKVELEAEPITGRTHQIRVHASEKGIPILGDDLYGGTPSARLWLHAEDLRFRHPASGEPLHFSSRAQFEEPISRALRNAIIDPDETNAYRLIHGAADGEPDWHIDRLGDYLLSQSSRALNSDQMSKLDACLRAMPDVRGVYHKVLTRHVGQRAVEVNSPRHMMGMAAPDAFVIRENGARFELSFSEGYSVGIFLDQRDNRRRLLRGYVAPDFDLFERPWGDGRVLNCFAYTCGFSLCAAKAGAHTTSIDLSKKYLEWGKRNFALNDLDPSLHEFLYGDVFDWAGRLARKGRRFDLILLDPPTFSRTKAGGNFQAERHYADLVRSVLPLLAPKGVLFASTNAARLSAADFVNFIRREIEAAGRKIGRFHYQPQPPDFPVHREEPAYLKTIWVQVV